MASVTALQAVRDTAAVKKGQSIIINGASGGVGIFAVQIAKAYGAVVTAVCSTKSIPVVRELGTDFTIDYSKENAACIGRQFDAVIDIAATLSVKDYRRLLKPGGICAVIGFSTIGHMLSYNFAGKRDGKKIKLCSADNKNGDELLEINRLAESGQLKVVIDSRYPLNNAAEALHRAESGHPAGKIIINIAEDDNE